MANPLETDVFEAHMTGLTDLLKERFKNVDLQLAYMNGRVLKTEGLAAKHDIDLLRIKTFWTAGIVLVGVGWQIFGNYIRHVFGGTP